MEKRFQDIRSIERKGWNMQDQAGKKWNPGCSMTEAIIYALRIRPIGETYNVENKALWVWQLLV